MMIKCSAMFMLSLLILTAACSSREDSSPNNKRSYQAISARGDTLYAPALKKEKRQKYEANLQKARQAFENNPDSTETLITYGQRTADLGQYREAIEIYSTGIDDHPGEARLYRLRGCEYIITRQFDQAISDLTKATDLLAEQHKPPTMPGSDMWLKLGIAQYLKGNFNEAAHSFQRSLHASPKDEMRVKSSYWLYMSLRRTGMDLQAGNVLESVNSDTDISENESYQKLLMVFKGDFKEKSLLKEVEKPLDNVTIGYGLGNWHYINGREQRARQLFKKVYDSNEWTAPGYIAAETDLERLNFK